MSGLELRPFNNPDNATIFGAIRNNASSEYQKRIPAADKADQVATINALLNWQPSMNEFIFSLVNVIGMQIFKNTVWTNPLAKFKRGMLQTGDTIEEVMNGLLEAHRYNPNAEYLEQDIFGTERPETQVNFHKINRKDYYKLTVNIVTLRQAFQTPQGLAEFISNLMSTPQTSDQWDEFLIISRLFKTWHDGGGYFNINVPDVGAYSDPDIDSSESRYLLRQMRQMGNTLPFLSTRYNPAGMPVFASADELELIITPEADAALDVEALAGAFNIDKAQFHARKTVIPSEHIGIPGFQSMLTTKDFFVIADTVLETQSANNPVGLTVNHFLHHQGVYSVSRFAPAVLFTSAEESTPIIINSTPVTAISAPTLVDAEGNAQTTIIRGNTYQVIASVTNNSGENNAIEFALSGVNSPRTHLWNTGILVTSVDESATTLTVHVQSVSNPLLTNSATFNIVGEEAQLWPNPQVLIDSNNDGTFEVTPAPLIVNDDGTVDIPQQDDVIWTKQFTAGVAFTAAGNVVTVPNHGARVGDTVKFGTVTSTTAVTAGTTYYVKAILSVNTFTIAATNGGAVLALNANGTAASATFSVETPDTETLATGQTVTYAATAASGAVIATGAVASFTLSH